MVMPAERSGLRGLFVRFMKMPCRTAQGHNSVGIAHVTIQHLSQFREPSVTIRGHKIPTLIIIVWLAWRTQWPPVTCGNHVNRFTIHANEMRFSQRDCTVRRVQGSIVIDESSASPHTFKGRIHKTTRFMYFEWHLVL